MFGLVDVNSIYNKNVAIDGGGIYFDRQVNTFIINSSVVTANTASRGGGIYFNLNNGKNITANSGSRDGDVIDNMQCINNTAVASGGCIYLSSQNTIKLNHCNISGNGAVVSGGGLHVDSNSSVSVIQSSFTSNFLRTLLFSILLGFHSLLFLKLENSWFKTKFADCIVIIQVIL